MLRYLFENTDDEHSANTNDLISVLADNGFSANRKTVRDDVDMICNAGYEILIDKDGKSNTYHFGSRTFEQPELKMLVDAVSSSRFISADKSDALIQKLASLTSKYEAEDLTARIFTADRIKADNGKIFLTTDVVSRAIEQEKKVSFQYYDYLPTKEKVLRNNGEVYIISPYALIWSDDRYYLVGYSDKRHELTPFRVDRMTVPQITDEPAVKNTSFNPADFANKVVQMYPSGNEQTVTLRCKNENMRSVIDIMLIQKVGGWSGFISGVHDVEATHGGNYLSMTSIGFPKISSWVIASLLGACTTQAGIQPVLGSKDIPTAKKACIYTAKNRLSNSRF